LNEERAIVSEIAGTTRDTIEEVINIDGILFRLIDTAGIRSHTLDIIETAGIERSLQKMKQADVVIYLFDVNEMEPDELREAIAQLKQHTGNFVLAANKVDKAAESDARQKFSHIEGCLFIAARDHLHLEVLKEKMVDIVLQDKLQTENVIVTNARHYHNLLQVHQSLKDIQAGMYNAIPSDLIALDIRRSLQYLGEITGEITNEDQLDYIFSKFCIGK
jgi:tRNA modification GTPase